MPSADTLERTQFLDRLRSRGQEIDHAGRLPADLVAEMVGEGLFRAAVPREYGGSELGIHDLVAMIEEVSAADGATGLVLCNAIVWQIFATRLPAAGYKRIYGAGPDVVIAGSFNGKAEAVQLADGGFRVRGRWAFSSGCQNAQWLIGSCVVSQDSPPGRYRPGERIAALIPASDISVHPNWNVSGMKGSGSHDFSADDVVIPADLTFSMYTGSQAPRGGIYDVPIISVLAVIASPVAVGICRSAIEEIRRLAIEKTPLRAQGSARVRDRASVKMAVAAAEADRLAARGLLRTAADLVSGWAQAGPGREPAALAERARLRLCTSHAVQLAAQAATRAYQAGGSTSIRDDSPLQRYFRDANTMTQLSIISDAQYEIVADALLDIELQNPEFL